MKCKNIYKWFLLLGLIFCIVTLPVLQVNAAEAERRAKRFNVVFVMDNSGSMEGKTGSDPDGWRYEALDLFLGLSTDWGNYIGAIAFNEDIVYRAEIKELSGNFEKGKFSQILQSVPVQGDTNIGTALLEAVKMLDQCGNPELPSAIILLTDGNTDLDSENKLEQAEKDKKTAIDHAIINHYPVYSICLNKFGNADDAELSNISRLTDGACEEISQPEDIKKVFNQFYDMIYDTETVTLIDTTIPVNGRLEKDFRIPEFGVEEVNIIISTLNYGTTYEIRRPSGIYTEDEIDRMKISARSFSIIKVIDPEPGPWEIAINGTAGDDIKITMVYNADYQVYMEHESENLYKDLGETITLKACLIDRETKLTDSRVYQENEALLSINCNGELQQMYMAAAGDGYAAEYKLNDYGFYKFKVGMPIEGMMEESRELSVYVENHVPKTEQTDLSWNIKTWRFGEDTYFYDVASIVSDVEDVVLQYEMIDSNEKEGRKKVSVKIMPDGLLAFSESTEPGLIFKEKLSKKSTVVIRATDSQGAYCDLKIDISRFAVNYLLGQIMIGVIAGILLLLIFLFWRSRNRKFNGEITVKSFDNYKGQYGSLKTISQSKGRVALHYYIQADCGIDLRKTWLQASGKNYVYLISAKGYYGTEGSKRKKKFRLYDGEEFIISDNEQLSSGISVTYHYNGKGIY